MNQPTLNELGYLYRMREINWAPFYNGEDQPRGKGTTTISVYRYPITKLTPKGAWIEVDGERKFVLLTATKQYACRSVEEARLSFIARKKAYIRIMDSRIESLEKALAIAEVDPFDAEWKWDSISSKVSSWDAQMKDFK